MTPQRPTPPQSRPGGTGLFAGRTVSRIGYGAMQLVTLQGDPAASVRLLRRAIDLGVNHIDTAQFYGDGFANTMIRAAVRPGDDVVIATKIGADPGPGGPYPISAQRPEQLRASVESNLTGLGVDSIPVVNLRRNDVGFSPSAAAGQDVDVDDQLAEMISLRDEGKIGAIGLSSVTMEVLRRALPAGIACVQNPYSLVSREDDGMLQLCVDERIAWVPYFPLGSAVPGLPKVAHEPAVIAVAEAMGSTPAQVGLAWLLHRAPNVLLIPGTANVRHLEANVAAAEIVLDAGALAVLDTVPRRAIAAPA